MAALEETTMVAEAVEEPVVEEPVVEEAVAAAKGAVVNAVAVMAEVRRVASPTVPAAAPIAAPAVVARLVATPTALVRDHTTHAMHALN